MNARTMASSPVPFDAARYLSDDTTITEYLNAVLDTEDPDLLLLALGDIARARGMRAVADASGLGRESLYKALTPGARPRFDTIQRVTRALGVRLVTVPLDGRAATDAEPRVSRNRRR